MAHRRVWLVIALVAIPSLTGCLSDLERVPLETTWEADSELYAGPVPLVDDRPAQLVLEGPVRISNATPVELTGISASLEGPNATFELSPLGLTLGEQTHAASQAVSENLELTDGDRIKVTFLPEDEEGANLTAVSWNLSAELRYRYRDGANFDAGRFTVEANRTPLAAPSLGVGVTTSNETGIQALVFEDLGGEVTTTEANVTVYHVSGGGLETIGDRTAQVTHREGAVTATLEEPVEQREGAGYLLLRLTAGEAQGVAVHADEPTEQALPAPGALVALVALATVAWAARRRVA